MKRSKSRIVFIVIIVAGLLFGLLLTWFGIYLTQSEYKPADESIIYQAPVTPLPNINTTFSFISWNIGYAGLGANMDFFYEGGTKVRDSKANTRENLKQISNFLKNIDSIDYYLLQEIDIDSKRSYFIDEFQYIDSILPEHIGFFGMNYNVQFVPVPIADPMGKTNCGIATFSKWEPDSVHRYSFLDNFTWPRRLFMPKACFLVSRFDMGGGKQLIVINTHNSAFDDGSLRLAQVKHLEKFAMNEFENGHYVVIGGDWNLCPPDFVPDYAEPFDTLDVQYIAQSFLKGWVKSFADNIPTNRRVVAPYKKGETLTTTIDFFVSSPNLKVIQCRVEELGFKNSDHQPVFVTFKRKD